MLPPIAFQMSFWSYVYFRLCPKCSISNLTAHQNLYFKKNPNTLTLNAYMGDSVFLSIFPLLGTHGNTVPKIAFVLTFPSAGMFPFAQILPNSKVCVKEEIREKLYSYICCRLGTGFYYGFQGCVDTKDQPLAF